MADNSYSKRRLTEQYDWLTEEGALDKLAELDPEDILDMLVDLRTRVETSEANFHKLHKILWARIDESREKSHTDLLKVSKAQAELAMSKEAREELRQRVDALLAACEAGTMVWCRQCRVAYDARFKLADCPHFSKDR